MNRLEGPMKEPYLKLCETVSPLLHGLCAPFLKLKIELTKHQAAN